MLVGHRVRVRMGWKQHLQYLKDVHDKFFVVRISAQTCALGPLSGTTKRDLSLYLRSGPKKKQFLDHLQDTRHPAACLSAWTQVSMGQGICKCVEDEGSTSASLDVTSALQLQLVDPAPNMPMHPMPCLIHKEYLFVRYSNGMNLDLDLLKSMINSSNSQHKMIPQVPVLQDHVKDAQAG